MASPPAGDEPLVPGEREFNECIRVPASRRIKVTLKPESDLSDLVGWISSMTCKRFIVPSSLRSQKVTLISPTAIPPAAAYRAFLSALEVMGLTVVPSPGGYLKVVQGNWATQSPIPLYTEDGRVPDSDAMVTYLQPVRYTDVQELMLVLNKMKSRSGDITAYRPTNTLIITDAASNVRRMRRIVQELDIEVSGEKLWVVRLRTADADEVLKILTQLFQAQQGAARPAPVKKGAKPPPPGAPAGEADNADVSASKMVADPVTNSLIIVATPAAFQRIAALIKKLDVEGEGVSERIHVYYLENGDAEEIAQTLSSLAVGQGGARPPGRGGARPPGGGGPATLFEGEVKVTADKSTNSLVIIASTKDYLSLRRVVRQLDIPRRQVFVEAIILEVSLNKERTIGVSAHGGAKVGSGDSESLIFGGLLPSQEFNSLLLNPAALTGLAAGARGALIDGSSELLGAGFPDIPAFGVLLQLLQTNNNLNVLSAPHILTTDNQQAEITVGQNLPFQGSFIGGGLGAPGGAGAAATAFLPQISVQRQDVALNLKLTPHVNESDMVRLEVEQEVSDIVAENFNQLGPATSKRSVKTAVVVRDQQTVVIGGLMADTVRDEETKIPLLGDIPILGYLFKRKKKSLRKTNLLLVLTPHVIRDQSDLRRIFKKKVQERREFLERYTSFEPHEVAHEVDYRHKRGLLGEIHRVGMQAEQEAELLDEAREQTQESVDPVEMPRDLSSGAEAPGGAIGQPATGEGGDAPSAVPPGHRAVLPPDEPPPAPDQAVQ